jgi:HAMP domain-containing protein
MTETNLKEYALKEGITKKIESMTQAEKVQLRYNYVMSVTTNAQGDFLRTSEGAANQMRLFKESIKETAASFGNVLLPIITPIIKKLNGVIQAFGKLDDAQKKTILIIGGIAAAIGPLLVGLGYAAIGFSKVTAAVKLLQTALITNPVTALLVGIGLAAAICIPKLISWTKETKAMREQTLVSIEPLNKLADAFMTVDLAAGRVNKAVDKMTLSQLKEQLKDVNIVLDEQGKIYANLSAAQVEEYKKTRESIQAEIELREKAKKEVDAVGASYDALNAAIEANNKIIASSDDEAIIASLRKENTEYERRIKHLDSLGIQYGLLGKMQRQEEELTEQLNLATTRAEITRITALIDKKKEEIALEEKLRGENVSRDIKITPLKTKEWTGPLQQLSAAQAAVIGNAKLFGWSIDENMLKPLKKLAKKGEAGDTDLGMTAMWKEWEDNAKSANTTVNILRDSMKDMANEIAQGSDNWKDFGKSALNALRQVVLGLIAKAIATAVGRTLEGPSGLLGPIGVGIAALSGGLVAGALGTLVPSFAGGARVDKPTLAMVGDAKDKRPEYILNTPQMEEFKNNIQEKMQRTMSAVMMAVSPALGVVTAGLSQIGNQKKSKTSDAGVYSLNSQNVNTRLQETQKNTQYSERLVAEISPRELRVLLLREDAYQNRGKR